MVAKIIVILNGRLIFSYAQSRKRRVFYLYNKIWLLPGTWVCALGPC